MKIYRVEERDEALIGGLFKVWRASVKATHSFLSEEEIQTIAGFVPSALRAVPVLLAAEDDQGAPTALMGIDGAKLEMLFIAPEERGKGLGRSLLQYGFDHYDLEEVCVNEQNPQAVGFYQRMGFRTYKRSETDEQGNPYPILCMKR